MISITTLKRTLLAAALLAFSHTAAHAWIFQEVPDKTVTVRYRLAVAANVSTAAVVIDLSDTANFKHTDTGQLNISSIKLDIDKAAASTTTVRLGAVNFVDSSTGSVTWFYAKESGLNVSNSNTVDFLSYVPNFLRLKVNPAATTQTDGSTPYLLSNDTTSGSTIYQTDVNLPSPIAAGVSAPGPGDVVMLVTNGTAAVTVNVEIQYHADKR
jgi:hypothetical protein